MKYLRVGIAFQEIPDEISLAFEITNCPYSCKGCHSPELQQDIGTELTLELFRSFIHENMCNSQLLISCILFLGGDHHHNELIELCKIAKSYGLKTALYTGSNRVSKDILNVLDWIKLGGYDESKGALGSETTNQILQLVKDLTENQIDLPAEYSNIVDKNFWNLI